MSMHGEKEKRKRKEKGHLAFQVPFLHVLAQSHESGTNGELTKRLQTFRKRFSAMRAEPENQASRKRSVFLRIQSAITRRRIAPAVDAIVSALMCSTSTTM